MNEPENIISTKDRLAALKKIRPRERTPEVRAQILDLEKRVLAQKQVMLSAKAAALRDADRKARTRRLIGYGALVEKSGLELDTATLLGALLTLAETLRSEPATATEWKRRGGIEINRGKDTSYQRRAVVVAFTKQPGAELRKALRALKLHWSPARQEWDGLADPDAVAALVEPAGGRMSLVEVAEP